MKNIFLFAIITLMCSCGVIKESNYVREELNLAEFSKLDISGAFDVQLTQGFPQKIVLEVEEHVRPYVKTIVKDGELNIYIEGRVSNYRKKKLYITANNISSIDLSGASSISVDNVITTEKFDAEINGASSFKGRVEAGMSNIEINGASSFKGGVDSEITNIEINGASKCDLEIQTNNLNVEVNGASSVTLYGNATNQKMEASGASKINAGDLKGESALVEARGASNVTVGATTLSKVDSSGASKVSKK